LVKDDVQKKKKKKEKRKKKKAFINELQACNLYFIREKTAKP
jgi:hypothetical protein